MNLYYNIKGSLERIKEIILFIPILYKARTWDYSSIFLILHHWIGRMRDAQLTSTTHHTSYFKIAEQMNVARILLNRLYKDEYFNILLAEHERVWGIAEYEFEEAGEYNGEPTYRVMTSRTNIKTLEDVVSERKDMDTLFDKATYLHNQDINLFFNLFKKHHKSWWV